MAELLVKVSVMSDLHSGAVIRTYSDSSTRLYQRPLLSRRPPASLLNRQHPCLNSLQLSLGSRIVYGILRTEYNSFCPAMHIHTYVSFYRVPLNDAHIMSSGFHTCIQRPRPPILRDAGYPASITSGRNAHGTSSLWFLGIWNKTMASKA